MSEQKTSNGYIIGGAIVIIAALMAFFTFPSTDVATTTTEVAEKPVNVEKKAIPASEVEEIVVIGDVKVDELVEKAQEAADRNQANEDDKSEESE